VINTEVKEKNNYASPPSGDAPLEERPEISFFDLAGDIYKCII